VYVISGCSFENRSGTLSILQKNKVAADLENNGLLFFAHTGILSFVFEIKANGSPFWHLLN